jgi:hypothetical protein
MPPPPPHPASIFKDDSTDAIIAESVPSDHFNVSGITIVSPPSLPVSQIYIYISGSSPNLAKRGNHQPTKEVVVRQKPKCARLQEKAQRDRFQ